MWRLEVFSKTGNFGEIRGHHPILLPILSVETSYKAFFVVVEVFLVFSFLCNQVVKKKRLKPDGSIGWVRGLCAGCNRPLYNLTRRALKHKNTYDSASGFATIY